MASERASLAVLFADVSGSTRRYEQIGDTAAFNQISDCLEIFTTAAKTFGGWVSQSIGDGLICVFTDADAAAVSIVFKGDEQVGLVTSGGYGYRLKQSIALAYLRTDLATPGTELTVEILGERRRAVVAVEPLYDPQNLRLKA